MLRTAAPVKRTQNTQRARLTDVAVVSAGAPYALTRPALNLLRSLTHNAVIPTSNGEEESASSLPAFRPLPTSFRSLWVGRRRARCCRFCIDHSSLTTHHRFSAIIRAMPFKSYVGGLHSLGDAFVGFCRWVPRPLTFKGAVVEVSVACWHYTESILSILSLRPA